MFIRNFKGMMGKMLFQPGGEYLARPIPALSMFKKGDLAGASVIFSSAFKGAEGASLLLLRDFTIQI